MESIKKKIPIEEIWQRVLSEVELTVSKPNFITWFKNTRAANQENSTLIVHVPHAFSKEWLENKFNKFIFKIIHEFSPEIKEIKYIIKQNNVKPLEGKSYKGKDALLDLEPQLELNINKETNLNPKYTFDSFIVGSSNELANAAAVAVCKNLGQVYNPLFIYGGVGLGKTHLIQAIGNYINKSDKKLKIKYVSGEKFTNELVNSIKNQETSQFKDKYRKLDVFIIDDVQFIAGKDKTQEELFHTFNSLYEKNKQIILSSDHQPKAIPFIEERLRSRFEGGMIADIGYPDFETRVAIIKIKLQEKKITLDDEVINYLASNFQNNIRELEGAINRIIARSILINQTPDLNFVIKSLAEIINKPKRITTFKKIVQVVSDFYDISEKDIFNRTRKQELVKPRQIIMYIMRKDLNNSFPYIGQKLGGRDHTTVIHACDKITKNLELNENLKEELLLIRQKL